MPDALAVAGSATGVDAEVEGVDVEGAAAAGEASTYPASSYTNDVRYTGARERNASSRRRAAPWLLLGAER